MLDELIKSNTDNIEYRILKANYLYENSNQY